MGDRYCKIELQNQGQELLIIKTFKSTGNEWTSIVDSVSLEPNEKFEIGHCINCSTLKLSDIDFNVMVIFGSSKKTKLIKRKELIDYLNKLEKVDCATYLIE